MPNTNQPAGAPGEKQNQDGMFQATFTVKDSAGREHTYERPDVTCKFRIASDGSLRDVVDMDGNAVEIRRVK